MLRGLPLQMQSFVDDPEFYCAVLRVPPDFAFSGAPLHLQVRLDLEACSRSNCSPLLF